MSRGSAAIPLRDDRGAREVGSPIREPQGLTPTHRLRRAITLLVMNLAAPGTAQLAAGSRRVGRVAVRSWAVLWAIVLLSGAAFGLSRSAVLSIYTNPVVLSAIAVVLFVVALAWPLLIADAWRLTRVGLLAPRARAGVTALAVLLVVATGVPTMAAGRRVWAGADLIRGVFGDGTSAEAVDGRYTVLLLGGDAGPDRIGTRPDSMTLVSIDARTGRSVLISLPRNLENVPFAPGSAGDKAWPQGWNCGDDCLLNGIYTWGSEHADLFPGEQDPGAAAMKQAVEGVTGVTVNYYALIDLRGFQQLIDAMGGVELTVNQRVPIGGGTSRVSGYIEPGRQRLDGYRALWFARSRHGASDYERMARQRCVMDAMVQQMDPATVLARFQEIAAASKNVVSTDIPVSDLGTFLALAAKAKNEPITSVQLVPPLIDPARPDLRLIRSTVADTIRASEEAPTTRPGGSVAEQTPPSKHPVTGSAGSTGTGANGTGSSEPGSAGTASATGTTGGGGAVLLSSVCGA